MTKLYMLLYIAGKLVGTWGPLPYDMGECVRRATDIMTTVNPDKTIAIDGILISGRDVQFVCEEHSIRPQLDPQKSGPR